MSLNYLSGDDIGRGRGQVRRQKRRPPPPPPPVDESESIEDDLLNDDFGDDLSTVNGKKGKARKAKRKAGKPARKEKRKRVFKKIAKVAVAPARAAFLTAVSLNLLKLATKLVRVWKKPSGKEQIAKFWSTFGGDINKLKKAIIKGSKQQINADSLGVVAATVLATATPIVVALVPIIKAFKAGGSEKEVAEFNEGVNEAKKDLRDNPDVEKGSASMPENKDAGIVTDKHGDAKEDEKETAKNRKPSESGGVDDHGSGGGSGSGSGGGSGEGSGAKGSGESEDEQKAKAEKAMASNFSPLGMFFMTLIYLMMFGDQNSVIVQLINSYCFLGMILIPIAISKNPFQKIAYIISFTPINLFNALNFKIKSLWQKKIYSTK